MIIIAQGEDTVIASEYYKQYTLSTERDTDIIYTKISAVSADDGLEVSLGYYEDDEFAVKELIRLSKALANGDALFEMRQEE